MIGIVVSRRCYAIERLWIEMFRGGFGATAAVDCGGDDASGISRPFAAWEEAGEVNVVERGIVAGDAHRRGCACFSSYQDGIIRQESARFPSELHEPFLQPPGNCRRKQFINARRMNAGGI